MLVCQDIAIYEAELNAALSFVLLLERGNENNLFSPTGNQINRILCLEASLFSVSYSNH